MKNDIFKFIFQDWTANRGNTKGRVFLILFRAANLCSRKKIYFYMGFPYLIFYKFFVEWWFCLEVPWNVRIGKNLAIYHGQSLIVHKNTIIGENCVLRHCTTIGNKLKRDGTYSDAPIIGNNVDIGSNSCIVGDVQIKDNVKIGCGAVVLKDVGGNCIVVGNPAVEKRFEN